MMLYHFVFILFIAGCVFSAPLPQFGSNGTEVHSITDHGNPESFSLGLDSATSKITQTSTPFVTSPVDGTDSSNSEPGPADTSLAGSTSGPAVLSSSRDVDPTEHSQTSLPIPPPTTSLTQQSISSPAVSLTSQQPSSEFQSASETSHLAVSSSIVPSLTSATPSSPVPTSTSVTFSVFPSSASASSSFATSLSETISSSLSPQPTSSSSLSERPAESATSGISSQASLSPTSVTSSANTPNTSNVSGSAPASSTNRASTTHRLPVPTPTTGPADIAAYLNGHNSARARHGAESLTWSDELANNAKSWAEACRFEHTNGALGPLGDNLAAGTGIFTAAAAVARFTGETYDPNHPQFNHLTQVVWKSTTELGCGVALCDNIFSKAVGPATLHVCLYNPVGNVVGQEAENVQA